MINTYVYPGNTDSQSKNRSVASRLLRQMFLLALVLFFVFLGSQKADAATVITGLGKGGTRHLLWPVSSPSLYAPSVNLF